MSDIDSVFALPVVGTTRTTSRRVTYQNMRGMSAGVPKSEPKTHVSVPVDVLEALLKRVNATRETVVKARARIGAACDTSEFEIGATSEFDIGAASALESDYDHTNEAPLDLPPLTVNHDRESENDIENDENENNVKATKDPQGMVEQLIKGVENLETEVIGGCEDFEAEASLRHGGCLIM